MYLYILRAKRQRLRRSLLVNVCYFHKLLLTLCPLSKLSASSFSNVSTSLKSGFQPGGWIRPLGKSPIQTYPGNRQLHFSPDQPAFLAPLLRSTRMDSTSALRMRYPLLAVGFGSTAIKLFRRISLRTVPTEHPNNSATSRVDNVWSLMSASYGESGRQSRGDGGSSDREIFCGRGRA
jgi:hypothetical protein